MAYVTTQCGGLKINTGSLRLLDGVVTDVNATSVTTPFVAICGGQRFDSAYFKTVNDAITLQEATTVTTKFNANCSLPFDSVNFAFDTNGAIEYNPDIVTTLTFTTTPADATVTVVDHNDMVISESSTAGAYPVLIGGSYTYTVSKAGYITEIATVTISTALTVDITLEQPTLTIAVSPADATVTVADAEGAAVVGVAGVYTVNMGGTYTYTVSKTGYVTQSAEIEIENAVEEVDVTLTKPTLTMAVTPTDATVTVVDSESSPVVPVDNVYTVDMGATYTWTASKTGYVTETANIEIENASTTVTVELQPETAP